jgi:hypothetical protein
VTADRGAPAGPAAPEHYVLAGGDGEVKRLYRVTSGKAEAWERFEWRPLDEARHDRIMRQVYFGLEDLDRLPDAEVWKVQAALRARATHVTMAWRLRTAGPMGLDEVLARLEPLGIGWTRIDSDSRPDFLGGFATGSIHLRILHLLGIGLFQLELTVWKEGVEGFDATFEEARAWVFDELVARLEPVDVTTSLPEER